MTTTRGAEEEARARTRRARPGHMWASGSAPPPPAASAECSWPDTFSAGRQQAAGTGRQAAVLHGGLFGVYLSPPGRAPAEAVTTAFSSWCFLWANRIVKAKRAGLAS